MTEQQAFEALGMIRELLTDIASVAADLEDEQLSVAVWKCQSWTVGAGNRMAELRREKAAV